MKPNEFTFDYLAELINSMLIPPDDSNKENSELVYGYTLAKLDRKIEKEPMDKASVSTAAVSNNPLEMIFNAEFMSYLNRKHQKGGIKHEVLHIVHKHLERFQHIYHPEKPLKEMTIKELFEHLHRCHVANVSMDAAINQFLVEDIPARLPEAYYKAHPDDEKPKGDTFVTYKGYQEMISSLDEECLKKVKEFDNAETYYRILMEAYNKAVKNGKVQRIFIKSKMFGNCANDGTSEIPGPNDLVIDLDDNATNSHKTGANDVKNNGGTMNPLLDQIIRNAIRNQQDYDNSRGVLPGKSVLRAFPKPNVTVDKDLWKKLTDKFFGDKLSDDVKMRYGRPSRKDEDRLWYKVHKLIGKRLYVIWDTSASISDGDCDRICGYLSKSLKKYSCDMTLIYCDVGVQGEPLRLKHIPKLGVDAKGRGGTDLTLALDWIEKKEPEKTQRHVNVLVFTDGETPWGKSKFNIYAIYTPKHTKLEHVKDFAILQEKES